MHHPSTPWSSIHPLPYLPAPGSLFHLFTHLPNYPIHPFSHQSLIAIGPSSYPSNPSIYYTVSFTYYLPQNLSFCLSIVLPMHPSTCPLASFPTHPRTHHLPPVHPPISHPLLCQPAYQPASWSIHCSRHIHRGRSCVPSIVPVTCTAAAAAHRTLVSRQALCLRPHWTLPSPFDKRGKRAGQPLARKLSDGFLLKAALQGRYCHHLADVETGAMGCAQGPGTREGQFFPSDHRWC